MMTCRCILLLFFVGIASSTTIDTVVVLMMENRAFDHILGFLKKIDPRVNGCLPGAEGCTTPEDPENKTSPRTTVSGGGLYVSESDPDHSVHGTTYELFGNNQKPPWPADPPMSGFVKRYNRGNRTGYGRHIMKCFEPEQVPALATLAQEFALFDRWFVGVPGPTMPNRAYSMSGTSHGTATNDVGKIILGWPQKTVYKQLEEAGVEDWRVYFQEVPTPLAFRDVRTPERLMKFRLMEEFKADAKNGSLPAFSWVDPRYFGLPGFPATDQHPNHPVDLGDKFIKEVYEAVRNGPKWNSTLLLITYDEHGGWYDHVPPPAGPSPDGLNSTDDPFDFTRLGVRVPTIAISPLIERGTLVSQPGTGGTARKLGSEFDATSMLATVRKLYNLPAPLTKRDEWAASFEGVLSRSEPRADCPTTLPDPPSHDELRCAAGHMPLQKDVRCAAGQVSKTKDEVNPELNDLQKMFVDSVSGITGVKPPNSMTDEAAAGSWVLSALSEYFCQQTGGMSPLCRSVRVV